MPLPVLSRRASPSRNPNRSPVRCAPAGYERAEGCMAQAFNDMIKVPGALVRVCQIAFLPALICVVSVLVLFIPLSVASRRPLAFCSLTWQACAALALLSSGVATCRSRTITEWSVPAALDLLWTGHLLVCHYERARVRGHYSGDWRGVLGA